VVVEEGVKIGVALALVLGELEGGAGPPGHDGSIGKEEPGNVPWA